MTRIDVATRFNRALGIRYPSQGRWSGQEFRETILRAAVEEAIRDGETVEVNFDGCIGLPTSFLEEAFGGLFRDHPEWTLEQVNGALKIVAPMNKKLWPFIDMAKGYMRIAAADRT